MTKISKIAKEKKFDQNEYVIHADGTVSKSFYIIREGEIGVVDANGDVSEMLSPGQYFRQVNTKAKESVQSRIWKALQLTFLFLLSPSNLFYWHRPVLFYLKTPKQVFF